MELLRYMIIDCNNDYFITEFDSFEDAKKYYNDLLSNINYDESIRFISFYDISVSSYHDRNEVNYVI